MSDAIFRVGSDTSDFDKGAKKVAKEVQDLTKDVKKLDKSFADAGRSGRRSIEEIVAASNARKGGGRGAGGAASTAATTIASRGGGGAAGTVAAAAMGLATGYAAVRIVTGIIRSADEYGKHLEANQRVRMQLERIGQGDKYGAIESFADRKEARTHGDDMRIKNLVAKDLAAGESSLTNAMKKVSLALDIEAAGLGDAEQVMSSFAAGSAEADKKLRMLAANAGINIKQGATLNEVMATLTQRVGGTAEAMARAQGGWGVFKYQLAEAREDIGRNTRGFLDNFVGGMGDTIAAFRSGDWEKIRAASSGDINARYGDDPTSMQNMAKEAVNAARNSGQLSKDRANAMRLAIDAATATGQSGELIDIMRAGKAGTLNDSYNPSSSAPTLAGGDRTFSGVETNKNKFAPVRSGGKITVEVRSAPNVPTRMAAQF